MTGASASGLQPVVAERPQAGKRLAVFHPVGGFLAADDVVRMADREALHLDPAPPRVVERLDPVRREDEVEVERTVSELDEVLAAADLVRLRLRQVEAQLAQGGDGGGPFVSLFSRKRSASWVVSG